MAMPKNCRIPPGLQSHIMRKMIINHGSWGTLFSDPIVKRQLLSFVNYWILLDAIGGNMFINYFNVAPILGAMSWGVHSGELMSTFTSAQFLALMARRSCSDKLLTCAARRKDREALHI